MLLLFVATCLGGCAIVQPYFRQRELQNAVRAKGTAVTTEGRYPVLAVFERLARAAGVDPAEVYVASMETAHVNAVSVGSHHFFVTAPILAGDDLCLSYGIAAHEFAHDLLGHSDRQVLAATAIGALATAAGFVVPFSGWAIQGAGFFGLRAYSRNQELRADARAIDLLEKIGRPRWNVRYALEFLWRVYGDRPGSWADTHPALTERLRAQPPPDQAQAEAWCGPASVREHRVDVVRRAIAAERAAAAEKKPNAPGMGYDPAPESCRGPRDRWTGYVCEPVK